MKKDDRVITVDQVRRGVVLVGHSEQQDAAGGDPAKLAAALLTITEMKNPPLRFVVKADAVAAVEEKANDLLTDRRPPRAVHAPGPRRRARMSRASTTISSIEVEVAAEAQEWMTSSRAAR